MEWKNQQSSFSIEDIHCCYCLKTSIWWNETHRPGRCRQTDLFSWIKNQCKCPGGVSRTRGWIQVSRWDRLPRGITVFLSKEDIFWNSKRFYLIFTRSIPFCSVSAHYHCKSRLREYQSFFESIHWGFGAEPAIFYRIHISAQCAAFQKANVTLAHQAAFQIKKPETSVCRLLGALDKWSREWLRRVIHGFTGCLFVVIDAASLSGLTHTTCEERPCSKHSIFTATAEYDERMWWIRGCS